MQTTTFGRSGLEVTVAGLGCGGPSRLGRSKGSEETQAEDIVRQALDLGVTLIDTAASYGTEEIVGRAIRGRREGLTIVTKVIPSASGSAKEIGNLHTPESLRAAVEGCLTRLGTDRVEVMMLHGVQAEAYAACRDQLLPTLLELRDEGKLLHLGVSELYQYDPGHRMLGMALDDDAWDVILLGFSMLNPSARETVLRAARSNNVGVVSMFAARDFLRDEVLKQRLSQEPDPAAALDRLVDAGYRFCRHEPGIHSVVAGTGSLAHLKTNFASIEAGPLSETEMAEAVRLLGEDAGPQRAAKDF